jgi:type IV pilus assembly protein PilB
MAKVSLRKPIGQILKDEGKITEEQLNKALEIQKSSGELLGYILVRMGIVSEKDVLEAYSQQIDVPYVDLEEVNIDLDAVRLVPRHIAQRHNLIPFKKYEDRLVVAMENPLNVFAIDELHMITGLRIECNIASKSQIEAAINEYYRAGMSLTETLQDIQVIDTTAVTEIAPVEEEEEETVDTARELSEEAPIVRMVNAIIMQAIRDRATDIHIEPQSRELRVRFRIDGVLHEALTPPKRLQAAIVSRIKIMANLDIAEKRLPQDGRIMLNVEGREFDFRVSTIPTMFGEKVEIRILDKTGVLLQIDKLGFSSDAQAIFEELINKPYGMILATGPTGCGKTTTLYSALHKLNTIDKNLITIEEPIEYQLHGVAQAQVNVKAGLTFANALRSILRQDPDIVMVGEIRDKETAEIAIHAALTGHLVLSTMHTNDAALTVVRFFHMGVEPFLISSSVIGIVSQRLARTICPKCIQSYEASSDTLRKLGLNIKSESVTLYRGRGCDYCKYTGYRGRTGIFEVMKIDDEIRNLIVRKASSTEIRETARRKGMKTLLEAGLEKVLEGTTTLEEVIRVVYVR